MNYICKFGKILNPAIVLMSTLRLDGGSNVVFSGHLKNFERVRQAKYFTLLLEKLKEVQNCKRKLLLCHPQK